jgi:hypothetical protein
MEPILANTSAKYSIGLMLLRLQETTKERCILISPFSAISFESLNRICIDAFKEHHQLRAFDFAWLVLPVHEAHFWKPKHSFLQAFSEDCEAIEVPPQHLDEVASPASKEKQRSRKWVLTDLALNQSKQAIEGKPHIDGLCADKYSYGR